MSPLKISAFAAVLFTLALQTCVAQSLLINGEFSTGDFTDWTQFVTTNGTIGTPTVTLFDTANTGNPALSAEFQAGNTRANGVQAGGGIYQNFTLLSVADLQFSMDTASFARYPNADGGTVSVLLDGQVFDDISFGDMGGAFTTKYDLLAANLTDVSAGQHQFEILVTRAYGAGSTPVQYVDNMSLESVPEPSSRELAMIMVVGYVIAARRNFEGAGSVRRNG